MLADYAIQTGWIVAVSVGIVMLATMLLEARRDLAHAKAAGEERLILNVRAIYRSLRAWLTAFTLFLAAGVASLLGGSPQITAAVLAVAVAQVSWSAVLSWRESRRLRRLIEDDIRARLRRERRREQIQRSRPTD